MTDHRHKYRDRLSGFYENRERFSEKPLRGCYDFWGSGGIYDDDDDEDKFVGSKAVKREVQLVKGTKRRERTWEKPPKTPDGKSLRKNADSDRGGDVYDGWSAFYDPSVETTDRDVDMT